jgi:dihydroorotate dehydrogenase electron transfer subunit
LNPFARTVAARVEEIRVIGGAGSWIDLFVPASFTPPKAGQFVEIACNAPDCFRLPRPFSLCGWRCEAEGSVLSILFSVVGAGSAWLASRATGDLVELTGPLGRPFRALPGRHPILIGGGRGVAPMLLLAEQIAEDHPEGMLLYGARDRAALFSTEACPFPVARSTLDGSVGIAGTVVDLLEGMIRQGSIRADSSALYACGPLAMLEAVSRFAERERMPIQVSVETIFGCGTGICAGCVIPIRATEGEKVDPFARYAFACAEGPVFDGSRIEWEGVRE